MNTNICKFEQHDHMVTHRDELRTRSMHGYIDTVINNMADQGVNSYEKVEEYRDFGGLRNEEDFLITDEGYRLLGKPLPKSIEEIEAVRG